MAKRKGYEQIRLADKTKLFDPAGIHSSAKAARPPSPGEGREKSREAAHNRSVHAS
jgi:hypothetical protein